jgi:hypothetical protein
MWQCREMEGVLKLLKDAVRPLGRGMLNTIPIRHLGRGFSV